MSIDVIWVSVWSIVLILCICGCLYKELKPKLKIANDIKRMKRANTYEEFYNYQAGGEPCYGTFSVTTTLPVSNSEYNIPNCVYGRLWFSGLVGNNGHYHTDHYAMWEDKAPTMCIDDVLVDTEGFINTLYKPPFEIIKVDENRSTQVMSTNHDYLLAYVPSLPYWYMHRDAKTPLNELLPCKIHWVGVIIRTSLCAIIAGWPLLSYIFVYLR